DPGRELSRPWTAGVSPASGGKSGRDARGPTLRSSLRRVLSAVAPHAQIGLFLMAPEAFDSAEAAAVFADHRARFGGFDFLIGARLKELADPEAAGIAGGALGRERVVGADHLVAVRDVGALAEKECAVIAQAAEIAARVAGQHFDMLGGDAV